MFLFCLYDSTWEGAHIIIREWSGGVQLPRVTKSKILVHISLRIVKKKSAPQGFGLGRNLNDPA
jgi:hypothetical protein